MSSFILVVNEEFFVPGDNQRCSNYSYNTCHGQFNTHAKNHCSKLGHTMVMNICNIDVWQRQKYLYSAESCYFMSLSDKLSYLVDRIMLLSQIIATMISTVKCEKIISLSPLKSLTANSTQTCMTLHRRVVQQIHVYCSDYVFNNMVISRRTLLDTLIQDFVMVRHLVAEISRFKFDDYRVIRTGASDLKLPRYIK